MAELKRLRAEQEMRDLERKQAEEERAAQALAEKAKAAATAAALAKSPVRVKGPPSEAVSPATAELQRLMMEEDELKKQISMAEAAKADLKKRKLQEARERNQQLKEKLAKISDSKASDGEGESEATSVATKLQPEKPPALASAPKPAAGEPSQAPLPKQSSPAKSEPPPPPALLKTGPGSELSAPSTTSGGSDTATGAGDTNLS